MSGYTPQAVLLIGVQGAGKSTFYRERFFDTHVRINRDMLKTPARERRLVEACLGAGQSFVLDNTNTKAADRRAFLATVKAAGFRAVGYYFDVPLGDAIRRNKARAGKAAIPVAGLVGTFKRLQAPTLDEGFDELFRVEVGAAGEFAVSAWPPVTAPT